MNRFLTGFNLIGVLALVGVCILQWTVNRQLNLEINRLERLRLEEAGKMRELGIQAADQAGDLGILRSNVASLAEALKLTSGSLAKKQHELERSRAEEQNLRASLTNWAGAVELRDDRLKQAAAQLKALINERDAVVKRLNEFAEQHNRLVKDWNSLQSGAAKEAQTNQ